MAEVVSNIKKAWVSTLNAGAFVSHGIGAGRGLTVTINLTQGWEIQVPVGVRYGSNVSLATPVYVYSTSDGGATFETEPLVAFSIPTTASVNKTASIRLTTGMYALVMIASSPSTTFFVLSQEVITAIVNN